MLTTTTPTTPVTPTPPAYLPEHVQRRWTETHKKALDQAKIDMPRNETGQRIAALKAANALLAVPAPTSHADIDKLEEWQVLKRETRTVKGKPHRFCVTSDGRKYSHPLPEETKSKQEAKADTKNESEKAK